MRIGIDARLWNETGVGRYIRNLVYELQEIDKKNQYVLFVYGANFSDATVSKNKNWKIVYTNIRWHTLAEQTKFPQVLEKENLDLLHFPYFSVPVLYKKPYIVTVHDLIIYHQATGKASTLPLPLYHAKRIAYKFILRKAITNARKILVPLDTVKVDLEKTFKIDKSKIVVTKEGVDNAVAGSKKQEASLHKESSLYKIQNTKYFLYVGNAYPHKNVEKLIDTFKVFHEEYPDVKLILVGNEDYFYTRLKAKVQAMHLEETMLFKEHVSDEMLSVYYAHAVSFISVSKMEGFGLPPLEAMANDCPVIVSAIPAFKEVCGDAALYVNPKDQADILEKMCHIMLLSEQSRKQMLAAGKNRVKLFSWQKMAQETFAVYDKSKPL